MVDPKKSYLSSGFIEEQALFCYCNELFSYEIISVYEIQRNEGTNEIRYKISPSDDYKTISYKNWCTKYN